ncbi:hypothetical protein BH10PLA1_BH10PLA1_03380 [soil metagenome]
MEIDRIITLANAPMKIQFIAMERSLRLCGCKLPIQVIPYDDNKFELPSGASWWLDSDVQRWLDSENASPRFRKYQCFLVKNYQFADPDIVFLKNPAEVLLPLDGFVATDTEWNKPQYTYSKESIGILASKSSLWQRSVFNSGQFASSVALYDFEGLRKMAMSPKCVQTCVHFPVHDQPGMNLLVAMAGTQITNTTLPPFDTESTWAGDYLGDYKSLWSDQSRMPYLIHWAGPVLELNRPINNLFYELLTRQERAEWDALMRERAAKSLSRYRSSLPWWKLPWHDVKQVAKRMVKTTPAKTSP